MNYQQSVIFTAFQNISGSIYKSASNVKNYFHLGAVNDSLLAENARLRQLIYSVPQPNLPDSVLVDTIRKTTFRLVHAYVINNTINRQKNIIVINKGKKHGIHPQMGVITDKGIIGIVTHTSENFSLIMSVLNDEFRVNAKIEESGELGSLSWDGNSPDYMLLKDIPNQVKVTKNHHVMVGPYSRFFPENTPIGIIEDFKMSSNSSLIEVKVRLHSKIRNLKNVYLVENKSAFELDNLEKQTSEE